MQRLERIFQRIEEKRKLLAAHRPLDQLQLQQLRKEFLVEYVHHSTAIEGNMLTLNETRLVLEEGITIGGKPLREHLDVINQKRALEWIEEWVQKGVRVTEADILLLHRMTLQGISEYWAGRYKTSQNRVVGSRLKTTPPHKVASEMANLVHSINTRKGHPVELAAFVHHELVRIHPFVDGNGRTARLLCNLLLMSKGYLPIMIRKAEQKRYFDTLEKAHRGDLEPFTVFFALRAEESLLRYLEAAIPARNGLLPLSDLAKGTKHSQEYLSLLARTGTLPATKIGRTWHSTHEQLDGYFARKKNGIGKK